MASGGPGKALGQSLGVDRLRRPIVTVREWLDLADLGPLKGPLSPICDTSELSVSQAPEPSIPSAFNGALAMRYFISVAMLMGLGSLPSPATANKHCSTHMYQRADASLVSAAGGWGSLLRHQKAFGSCDDGALAEGYSDAVVSLLAHHWDRFDELVALSGRNSNFSRWAIRHIDASASAGDLKQVVRNSAGCTGSAKRRAVCGEVGRAARDALKD